MDKYKKILITGAKGQLGSDLLIELNKRGYNNVYGVDKDTLDLTIELKVMEFITEFSPDVIIHCAAWTNVDKAESNKDLVYDINVNATKYIVEAANLVDAKLIFISTEYVFDGMGDIPFKTNDKKNPLSIYGKSKSEAEDIVINNMDKYFIVRISGAFGKYGNNFVKKMILLSKDHKELNVVSDQIVGVTYTKDLSKLLIDMVESDKYGIYHATNEGYVSWALFAKKIFEYKNIDVKVNPISTKDYLRLVPNQAKRPLNSRLDKESLDKAGFSRLPSWCDALYRYLKEIEEI